MHFYFESEIQIPTDRCASEADQTDHHLPQPTVPDNRTVAMVTSKPILNASRGTR
jgi:hypothetical protein